MAVSSISFSIDVDLKQVQSGLNEAQSSMKAAAATAKTAGQQMAKGVEQATKPVKNTKSVFSQLRESLATVKQSLGGFSSPLSGVVNGFGQIIAKAAKFSTVVLALKAVNAAISGIKDNLSGAIDLSDSLQKYQATLQFAGLDSSQINDSKKAMKLYADETIYSLEDILGTSATLAANGVGNFQDVTKALAGVNSIAGGNADTFKSVTQAFTQTIAGGKLTTENFLQLTEAIPGISGALQNALRDSNAFSGNFRDAMADGQISAEELTAAISELGLSDVAQEAATSASTFEGAVGAMQANVQSGIAGVIDAIGKDKIVGVINQASEAVGNAFSGLSAWISSTDFTPIANGIKTAFDAVSNVVTVVAEAVGVLWDKFSKSEVATSAFNAVKDAAGKLAEAMQGLTVEDVLNALSRLKDILVENAPIIATIVGAFVALKVAMAISAVITAVSAAFALITTPIGLVALAIAGLIGVIVWVVQNWDMLKATTLATWEAIKSAVSTALAAIVAFVQPILASIAGFFSTVWEGIKAAATAAWNFIYTIIYYWLFTIATIIGTVLNMWKAVITTAMDIIKAIFDFIWGAIGDKVMAVVTAISNGISAAWDWISSKTTAAFNAVSSVVSSVWNAVSSATSNAWNAVSSAVGNAVNAVKSKVSSVFNAVKSTVSGVWDSIKSGTSSAWNSVKEAISKPINAAKDAVGKAIDKIKSLFSFKISWPKIPMPHFSIEGSFNPLKLQVPHLGVSWYKTGGIFTGPSVVGLGEAGDEAVVPLSNKKRMAPFANAVANMMAKRGQGMPQISPTAYMREDANSVAVDVQVDNHLTAAVEMDKRLVGKLVAESVRTENNKVETRKLRKAGITTA